MGVSYDTSNKDPMEAEEFFLSLPRTRKFRLHFTGYFHIVNETIKRLVDRSEDFLLDIVTFNTPHQLLHDIFKIVLNSLGPKRVELRRLPKPDINDIKFVDKSDPNFGLVDVKCFDMSPGGRTPTNRRYNHGATFNTGYKIILTKK
ncbi:hypothetical protein PFISCL1PPCAC_4944 [Pristionchus fissidentatus]|uniref:Uncharacterized protein n=1 Tax=Pristionchus fissidentatus TaxID=1538716 RepID=A0AAV5V5T3_9BILA|nr:hypothetical protein PFISCL1PPCAC_4944 [Pristionchus fissidentatus]